MEREITKCVGRRHVDSSARYSNCELHSLSLCWSHRERRHGQVPLSILFSTPSSRMASPHCLHSKTCVLDKRIKPPQVGQGTSWSVLTAETRTALDSRARRSRGRCNDGKINTLYRGP